jgi:hypothetical protein
MGKRNFGPLCNMLHGRSDNKVHFDFDFDFCADLFSLFLIFSVPVKVVCIPDKEVKKSRTDPRYIQELSEKPNKPKAKYIYIYMT